MAIVEVSITPLGTDTTGVSQYVAGCLKIVRKSGIPHQLTPMGTILEGELDQIFGLIREMQEATFAAGAIRVSTLIKIDDRRDKQHTMAGKVRAVERKLEGEQ
ncbi:MTH1187 family thiamine-binding protein [Geobacter sp. DSM 9736]|uniref:MTH1187 family thiamine-binding protein n=1 Tax=Geobacter sp. DSM 9736 TaxID=1277350 RepID=UPI000B4FDF3E|nr:MTH1187 family thiamine-binding protein [Geobacter sp. DSM 9736]SNB48010.1 uncharacterized protein, MTH1187 family [Geobacter sp. DSM 9736]